MQLTLINARLIDLVARQRDRWPLAGDQLFVDLDLSAANLPPGTRLALGSAVIEVTEGQVVVSTGPYALVRHPMYAYVLLLMIGAPLLLGSLWGLLFGFAVFVPLLALRIHGEEAMLMTGLAGYQEYVRSVRYRLVPGIW